ncbi:MAG: glycosyltransferase [Lachnospiraceae bacterium]|nr:glycosyltransferase [Lachnospiraceae bacterium]
MQKVSLLITTYNVKEHLTVTLESIRAQDYSSIEVVIVDGGSTDGTVDTIREFAASAPIELGIRWISEPDRGLYDAMNKAWSMCTGDIVAVCNDKLCTPDAVTKLVRAIEQGGDGCIGAHSDLIYTDGERIVRSWHMGEGRLKDGWMPGHPTLFIKRQIYEKYGVYDISYRCAADYEFMVRFLKDEKNRLAYVPEVLVAMFYGGTSNAGLGNYLVSFKEGYMALKKNGVPHPLFITIKRTFRVLRQF